MEYNHSDELNKEIIKLCVNSDAPIHSTHSILGAIKLLILEVRDLKEEIKQLHELF